MEGARGVQIQFLSIKVENFTLDSTSFELNSAQYVRDLNTGLSPNQVLTHAARARRALVRVNWALNV